jgi:hypothetical protein
VQRITFVIAIAILICVGPRFGFLAAQPTDTHLRAAFCIGALDVFIAGYSEPIPRGDYFSGEVLRQLQNDQAQTILALTNIRHRLQRFLLPYLIDTNLLLAIVAAKQAGRQRTQECITIDTLKNNDYCEPLKKCAKPDWMPY